MKDFPAKRHPQTCPDGRLYRPAVGNSAPTESLQDQAEPTHSVVSGKVTAVEFVDLIKRELRLRLYQPNTIKSCTSALQRFLQWFARPPHSATREDVREQRFTARLSCSVVTKCSAALLSCYRAVAASGRWLCVSGGRAAVRSEASFAPHD